MEMKKQNHNDYEYLQKLQFYKLPKIRPWVKRETILSIKTLQARFPIDLNALNTLINMGERRLQISSNKSHIFHIEKMEKYIQEIILAEKEITYEELAKKTKLTKKDINNFLKSFRE